MSGCSDVWVANTDDTRGAALVEGWREVDVAVLPVTDLEPIGLDVEAEPLGNTYVLNFWTSWCPPCRKELSWFVELYENGTSVVGVNRDVRLQYAVDEVRDRRLTFPSYSDLTGDFTASLDGVLPFRAVPATIIVSAGRVRWVHVGPFASYGELERTVRSRIAGLS